MINKTNIDLIKLLKSPEMKEKILAMDNIILNNTPDEFTTYIKTEIDK